MTLGARWVAVAAAAVLCAGCKTSPDQAAKVTDLPAPAKPAAIPPHPPHPPVTHVVVESDHLHLLALDVGDFVEAPADDAFDWTMHWQGEAVLEKVSAPDAGRERYRVTKAGGAHLLVDGYPKCLKLDAGCGTSQREWTLFMVTHG
ncbi:MAG TPA: hypothetical protein VGI39_38800 [Polyangiaceae bacterium]|jgi:hypothetical protein